MPLKLSGLPDSLLQLIFSYLDNYDQRVFLVLSTQFVRLGDDISIFDLCPHLMNLFDLLRFMRNLIRSGLNSKKLANIQNGYDRLDLPFIATKVEVLRDDIIKSYKRRMKEEAKKGRKLPPPSENLFDMILEMWSFTSVRKLSADLRGILFLLEGRKLERLQILSIYFEAKEDNNENIIKLFDLLRQGDRCSSLQLKRLEIVEEYDYAVSDDGNGVNEGFKHHLPSFDVFSGLHSLHLRGFVIPKNPGCGIQSLKVLELDRCVLECDVSHFDGVDCLRLDECTYDNKLPAFKITRHVYISSQLKEGDNFRTASVLDLWVDKDYNDAIHLDQFDDARSVSLKGYYRSKVATIFMPEKFSDKLKVLCIEGFELLLDPLPCNRLKLVKFSGIKASHAFLQSLRNIENVFLYNCEISLESLGSGIKSITMEYCRVVDPSPPQSCEKVTIMNSQINNTLNLSNVKELTIVYCEFHLREESNGLFLPYISNYQKLEMLKTDLNLDEKVLSQLPSLKKIVIDTANRKNYCSLNFQVCLIPHSNSFYFYETYLLTKPIKRRNKFVSWIKSFFFSSY